MRRLLLLACLALAACGVGGNEAPGDPSPGADAVDLFETLVWARPDQPPENLSADLEACQEQAELSHPRANALARLSLALNCLEQKGWRYRAPGAAAAGDPPRVDGTAPEGLR